MTQQLTPNQQQWITALRSGGYNQGTGCLHSSDGFCCLGVAAKEFLTDDVVVAEHFSDYVSAEHMWSYDDETDMAPDYVMKALGLYDNNGTSETQLIAPVDIADSLMLTTMNDNGKTFEQIADILEANPENYFREYHTL
jgi:hypothetical protein